MVTRSVLYAAAALVKVLFFFFFRWQNSFKALAVRQSRLLFFVFLPWLRVSPPGSAAPKRRPNGFFSVPVRVVASTRANVATSFLPYDDLGLRGINRDEQSMKLLLPIIFVLPCQREHDELGEIFTDICLSDIY